MGAGVELSHGNDAMAIFDAYFKKIAEYVEALRGEGRQVREVDSPGTASELKEGLPVRVGPQAGGGLILRGDTFLELGSPEAGSCAFVLWTDQLSLVRDGRVTLIGPDITESEGASLPFGQVVMVAGTGLGQSEHSALDQSQYVSDQIEGYMIKSTPGRMWSRVSRDAADKGLGFHDLGKALMAIFRSEVDKTEGVEILFVTSSKDDVQRIDDIAAQVQKIGKDIVREVWLARGYDILECTIGGDCGSCTDKPVCDEIRELITVRKKKTGRTKKTTKARATRK
jgi:CO dehydrogenase/acetyl-CoA synthase beta subunit